MRDRDTKINIRKVVSESGPHNTPAYSDDKYVYGTMKDAGAEEKERAKASGRANTFRVDINEEEYAGETVASFAGQTQLYDIYKTAKVKNKVYLYLSDKG